MHIFKTLPKNLDVHCHSGKLMVLDDPNTIYILQEGDINLFLVEFGEDGRPGNRVYYGSLSSFNCHALRGIAPHSTSKVKLCAVANLHTTYVKLPYKDIHILNEEDASLLQTQLNIFLQNLLTYAGTNANVSSAEIERYFTDNNRMLYDVFENYIFYKKEEFANQYVKLQEESQKSFKKSFSNLFRFFSTKNTYSFDENEQTLSGAMSALGKIQKIPFITENYDPSADDYYNIDRICKQSSIRKREITLEPHWQKKHGLPFLGKLETGENVAIFNFEDDDGLWHCFNSATEKLDVVDDSFAEKILPRGMIFYKPFPQKPITLKVLLSLIWESVKIDCNKALLFFFIVALLSATIPIINSVIFSTVIPMADCQLLMQIFVLATGFALAKGTIEYLTMLLLLRMRTRVAWAMQAALWDKLLNTPLDFFKEFSIGDMTNRSLGITQLATILSNTFLKNVFTSIFTFPALFLMFYYSPFYAGVMIFFIFIMTICFFICAFISYKIHKDMADIMGGIQGDTVQYFNGIHKIRSTGTENHVLAHWSEKFSLQKHIYFKLSQYNKYTLLLSSGIPIFTITLMIAITNYTFAHTPESMISLSDFVAFASALSIVSAALSTMFTSLMDAIEVIPLYQRLKPLLECPVEKNIWQNEIDELTGTINIQHVTFAYDPSQRAILQGISLQIAPGEFVAIVGESGSGKSTLLRLLLGFEKPLQGSISYDNFDVNQVNLRHLRSQLGVVLQDSRLIPDTIYKNIIAGSTSLTEEDAWQAAIQAGCAQDIKAMPMQMHTMLSGMDGSISGGQKQRILIARALAKKPKILFFDEATNALDNTSQSIVCQTIAQLKITKIIIAHRLSTIIDADRIIVLDKGKIIEQGTYDELLQQGGFFSRLAKRQLIK